MSDSWLMFIPTDPEALPSKAAAEKALELLKSFAPESQNVCAKFGEKIEFHSGVENWSGVRCPGCGADIEAWWNGAIEKASRTDFQNLNVTTPCCAHITTLNELNYVWPAGFSRFGLEAVNPNIKDTTDEQDRALSEALGFELRKIWVHI